MSRKRITQEEFIKRCKESHEIEYNYSKSVYSISNNNVIVICKIHGEFLQNTNVHMRGGNCPYCLNEKTSLRSRKTKEQFIIDSEKIHGKEYDYSKFEYLNAHNKSIIICSSHGDFLQSANTHLKGNRCPRCSKEKADKWGWSKSKWLEIAKKNYPRLYVTKVYNENEEFLKVGITTKIKAKYRLVQLPYQYEILSEIEDEGEIIWNLENKIKRELRKENKYVPQIFFKGMYECYNINSLNKILKLCEEKGY